MANRPKHQRPELEAILREGEGKGWVVTRGKRYYMMRCGGGHRDHQKTVRLTPSDPNYARNLLGWLKRSGCWESEGPDE